MQGPTAATVYSVDAGGSNTLAAVSYAGGPSETWARPSFAIASAGERTAQILLESILREICVRVGRDSNVVGCIASSSMPAFDEAPAPAELLNVIASHAPVGRVVVVNDVVPLLWSATINGVGVVVCSGTGSSVIGRDSGGRLVKVGGHEHIISDQGSAYSLAREGLRAAARDADGTGPATKLRPAAEAFFGRPISALGRWLAELPRARTTVASFAPGVTTSAENDDEVARAIVNTEVAALVHAVEAAVSRLTLEPMPRIGLAGGVLHGSGYFRTEVERELSRCGLADAARSNVQLVEATGAAIRFALRLSGPTGRDGLPFLPDGVVLDVGRGGAEWRSALTAAPESFGPDRA